MLLQRANEEARQTQSLALEERSKGEHARTRNGSGGVGK